MLKLQHEENQRQHTRSIDLEERAHQRALEVFDREEDKRLRLAEELTKLTPALQDYAKAVREYPSLPDPFAKERQDYRKELVDELKENVEGYIGDREFVINEEDEDNVKRLVRMKFPAPGHPDVPSHILRLIEQVCPEERLP